MRTKSTNGFEQDDDLPIGEYLLSPIGWLGALAIVIACAGGQLLDIPDNSSEWPRSQELHAEQAAQERVERTARAAQAMCDADHGPQALAVWVDTSTVECVSPRGRRLSRSNVQEALHAPR